MTVLLGVETGHVVHFYDHEETLALAVADFLGLGLAEGGPALVVATPGHRAAIARVLEAAGIDIAAARAENQYVEFDAQELLSRFTFDGTVNAARFGQTIPPVVDALNRAAEPLRVYGEMVDLLWCQGNVQAAHDLELLWNSIGAGRDFPLFCAYSSTVVDSVHADGRQSVADHHNSVVAGLADHRAGEAARQFEPTLFAAGAARRFARETLNSWGLAPVLPEVELVISELATNAAVHTASRFTVALTRLDGGRVRVEVSDGSRNLPTVRNEEPFGTGGRGLRIISAVAEDWSVESGPFGKIVWAVLGQRPVHH